ncbi:helix-turn-helix domain-containing protein [Iningainema tapete]|uniref:Helix-turn-helix domain-containing protein n=1 Tax=Iningainema tapete BLCC-T55 TaxID=2748662 RepID=A0A8J6XRK2_9CYAN|nr:helix-turn-helix domain-containing protein [Iningainema tapete BLCC-T55]
MIGINGGASLRQIAAATGFSKSSVHRHLQAMAARQQQPGGALWELESGQQWLRVLVCAVVYLFGVQQGIGNERLSEFFHLVHLERHIGVSPTAIAGNKIAGGATNSGLSRQTTGGVSHGRGVRRNLCGRG